MKRHILTAMLAAAFGAFGGQTLAQWQPSDTFRIGDNLGASAGDICTDYSGTLLYAVGSSIMPDGSQKAIVRASADAGETWNTLNIYADPGSQSAHFRGVASAAWGGPQGSLFVAGAEGTSHLHWVVRRSTDQGFTWETVDSPDAGLPNNVSTAGDIRPTPAGDVFAVGTQGPSGASVPWVVRMSSQGGNPGTWRTVDQQGVGIAGFSEARFIAYDSTGAIYVCGRVFTKSTFTPVWTVRKSSNRGAAWTTVDSYVETKGEPSGAEAMAISGNSIYVAGYARGVVKKTASDYWVVRRSTNGGGTWTVLDKITASDGGFLSPTTMIADAAGKIWVGGYTGPSSAPNVWCVRKGTLAANGAITWTNSDLFTFSNGARVNGITSDAHGNIFATGRYTDSVENWWATRKLSP